METAESILAAASINPSANEVLSDLASIATEDLDSVEDDFVSDAQRHWDENILQLENAVFLILCPVIGRVLGRRFAQRLWFSFCDYRWNAKGRLLLKSS